MSGNLKKPLFRLWQHISPRRRSQFVLVLALMVVTSFAEIISIGAVLPFLAVLTAPEHLYQHPAADSLIRYLGITSPEPLLFLFTIAFGFAAIVAGAMRLLLSWASIRLAYGTGADLSLSIYKRTLYQPYSVHLSRNSSEVITGILTKVNGVINNNINPVLTLISSTLMFLAILIALISIEPQISIYAFICFGLVYLAIGALTKKKRILNGQRIANGSTQVVKTLQEGLGGIRDVLIDGSQANYCDVYRILDGRLRRAIGDNQFVAQSPRFVVEALGMTLIAGLAYALAQQTDGVAKVIPVLGALAIGAQRLLPLMQQSYAAWSLIQGGHASFMDTLALLEQPLPDYADQPQQEAITFCNEIRLKSVSFRYKPETTWIFQGLNLVIPKGSRVGFIGTTGSGKSTLLDIIMGLLSPSEGVLEIDGQRINEANHRAWQAHIAHVPQSIFLTDNTIEQNIAFGVPNNKIDHERVRQAARHAQIADLIEGWQDGYSTAVGERGVCLSGGQRQRIGIARALYKNADVIIFDEATSALDNETEQSVMEAIEGLSENLTILIIAHRLSTLKNCSQIIELGDCGVRRIGNYQEIVTTAA
jgi:ABC-type multidrug transport system fused ATPase/permease subunit